MRFATKNKRALLASAVVLLSSVTPAQAVFRTWLSTSSGSVNNNGNWDGTPGTADETRFTNLGDNNPTVDSAFNVMYIGFSGSPATPSASLGVIPNYNFTGSGKITISANGNIDTFLGQTGTVTFNNTGGIDLTRAASLYGASGTGGTSNLVIGANTPLRMGLGTASGTPAINAWGSNVTVNSVAGLDYSGAGINRALILNPFTGKSINLTTGVTATTRLTGLNITGQTGGKVFLGASPTASTWGGTVTINTADLVITDNNSLGAVGSINTPTITGYVQTSIGTATGALILSNSVVPAGITSGESIFWSPRTTDVNASIKNQSGHNTLSGLILADGVANQTDLNYNIEAQGIVGTDIFEISGTLAKSTYATNAGTINLKGTGSGLVSGTISGTIVASGGSTRDGGSWGVTKKDSGTWTFTGNNTYTGPTVIQQGTLALSGAGAIGSSSSIAVKSGAFFNVTGLSGSTFALGGAQTLAGAGTVTGSISTTGGSIVAPGDVGVNNGIGTLSITGGLSLASATLQLDLTNVSTTNSGVNDKITLGGALSTSGVTTIQVNMTNGVLGSGTYRLMDYVGSAANLADFTLAGITLSPRQTSATLSSVANQLNLDVVGGPATLNWVGGNSGDAWDVGTTVNWTGAGDNRFFNGDIVVFGSTSNTNTPNITGTVNPGSVLFNSASQGYTFSGGTLASTSDITFNGAGSVTFNNSQVTTGANLVSSGSGTVNFATGAVTTVSGNFTSTGSNTINVNSGGLAVTGNYNNGGSTNVNLNGGNFTVTGTFTQSGTGTTTIANSGSLLTLPSTINITGGTVALNRTEDFTVAGANPIATVLAGSGTFRKDGINTVEVTANNTGFTGTTVIANGVLKTRSTTALTNTVIQSGATLDLGNNGTAAPGTGGSAVTVAGHGFDGLGAIKVVIGGPAAGNNAHIGALTFTADSTILVKSPAPLTTNRAILWVDGAISGNGHDLNAVIDPSLGVVEMDFIGNGNTNFKNVNISGGGGILYLGKDTSIDNTTAGKITLDDKGQFAFYGSTQSSAWTGVVTKPVEVLASANGGGVHSYLNTTGSITVASTFTLNANLDLAGYTSASTTAANNTLYDNTVNRLTITGAIVDGTSGVGSVSAHLNGGTGTALTTRLGMIELTSNGNTYTGPTVIGGGGGLTAAPAAADRVTLSIGNGGATGSIGAGAITINGGAGVGTARLVFNRNNALSIGNDIHGAGNVEQAGSGTTTVSGAILDYTGNTTVSAGTLNITGNHTGGANYSVASGANLITNNVRVSNALTVDGTATINTNGGAAGASKAETLTINAGGKLNLKDNDIVVGTGTVAPVRDAIKLGLTGTAGITSDLPAFAVTTGFGYALGNDANLSPSLAGSLTGQTYDADSVLVKYTYLGDADLDGDTDLNDLGLWAQSFTGDLGSPAIPVTFWTNGDFDYDGDTDLNDLGLWAGTFTGDLGGGAGSLIVSAPNAPTGAVAALNSMGITVVPEPSTFVLAGVGLAGLAIAARRKQCA